MLQNNSDNWWQSAIIYQVYCRSFFDSNNDGIGDIKGVCAKLDYISSLGVDAVWLTPFFPSPMKDMGYDVSEYCDIDPMFGNLSDFDQLIKQAHERKLKIIIDLVLSHTSDQHPWFQQSAANKNNDKSDWYVWADAGDKGEEPNNWLSLFGGSSWQWHETRQEYYLHNFLASQPDLNLHNPQVQQALLKIADFWCQRGIDGFRLDTVNFYFHDQQLRSNPALDDPSFETTPESNPYSYQNHIYDKNRPENLEFLARLRQLTYSYKVITLGELGEDGDKCLQLIEQYTQANQRLNLCYGFDLLSGTISADKIRSMLAAEQQYAQNAMICRAFSNHDVMRHLSRWNSSEEHWYACALLALNLLLSLKGASCIYQGEELGLPEARIAPEDMQDPYGKAFWPEHVGRDGCRTPMPWNSNEPNAGFSKTTPWLPVDERHYQLAIDKQQAESILYAYRQWIDWHKNRPATISGTIESMPTSGDLISYKRQSSEETMLVVMCLANKGTSTVLSENWQNTAPTGYGCRINSDELILDPWGFAFFIQSNKTEK